MDKSLETTTEQEYTVEESNKGLMDSVQALWLKYGQIIKFIIAGGTGAVIEIGLYEVLAQYTEMHYILASTIATVSAITLNYIISRIWVFETGRHSNRVEMMMFFVVSGFIVLLNQLCMWALVEWVQLPELISKGLAIAIVSIVNFKIKKLFIFKN